MTFALVALALAASPIQIAASLVPGSFEQGAWVEYRVGIGPGQPVFVRLSVVGEETLGTEQGSWVELWISARPGSATQVYRALVVGSLDRPGAIRRVLARLGGGAVLELPAASFAGVARPAGEPGPGGTVESRKSMHTEAGTFQVEERTFRAGAATVHLDTSTDVPLGGVVRLEVSGLCAELQGTGRDAQSGIPPGAEVRPLPTGGSR